ncbi:MAG TPA: hypothetical protein VIT00_14295, partial [Terrimicrobiaceae bacterium]
IFAGSLRIGGIDVNRPKRRATRRLALARLVPGHHCLHATKRIVGWQKEPLPVGGLTQRGGIETEVMLA